MKGRLWLGTSVVLPLFHESSTPASSFSDFYSCKGFMLVQVLPDYTSLAKVRPAGLLLCLKRQWEMFHVTYAITSEIISPLSASGSLLGPSTSSHKSQAYAHGWGEECPCHLPRATRWWGPQFTSSTTQFAHNLDCRYSKQLPEPKALS